MGLDLGLDPLAGSLQADSAVDVVQDRGHHQRHHQRGEQPAHHEAEERQTEHVEADVSAELGIGDAEVHAVGEQQPLLPPARYTQSGDEGKQARQDEAHQPSPATHHQVVAAQQVLLRPGWPDAGGQAVGHRQVPVQHPEEQQSEQGHQHDLGTQDRDEHVLVTQGVEPQVVGPEAGDSPQGEQKNEERRHDPANYQADLARPPGRTPATKEEGTRPGRWSVFGRWGVFRAHVGSLRPTRGTENCEPNSHDGDGSAMPPVCVVEAR